MVRRGRGAILGFHTVERSITLSELGGAHISLTEDAGRPRPVVGAASRDGRLKRQALQ